ncbi:hypothetical protein V1511DRAFT_496179 [Dipodascopsis uninucleata]
MLRYLNRAGLSRQRSIQGLENRKSCRIRLFGYIPFLEKTKREIPRNETIGTKLPSNISTLQSSRVNGMVLHKLQPGRTYSSATIEKNVFAREPFTLGTLRQRVWLEILRKEDKIPASTTMLALEACEQLIRTAGKNEKTISEASSETSDLFDLSLINSELNELITEILNHQMTTVDTTLLKHYLLLRPTTNRAINAINIFYNRQENKGKHIPKDVFMIPFRKCLRDEDVNGAFRLLDLTANSPQWYGYLKRWWTKVSLVWATGIGSIMELSELLMRSDIIMEGGLENTGVIQLMLITYLLNSSVLALVACASRPGDNGGKVLWRNGVFQNKWYLHSQETRMLNQIVDMDMERIENNGDISPKVLNELANRDRRLGDSSDDIVLKQYWAKQGQGFEWVEPDIDPAEEQKLKRDVKKLEQLGLQDGSYSVPRTINIKNDEWVQSLYKLI